LIQIIINNHWLHILVNVPKDEWGAVKAQPTSALPEDVMLPGGEFLRSKKHRAAPTAAPQELSESGVVRRGKKTLQEPPGKKKKGKKPQRRA
jgi:hypothetical protein